MSVRNETLLDESSNASGLSKATRPKASDVYGSPVRKLVFRPPINYSIEPEVPRGFSNQKSLMAYQDTFEVDAEFSFSKKSDRVEAEDSASQLVEGVNDHSPKETSGPGIMFMNFTSELTRETGQCQPLHNPRK